MNLAMNLHDLELLEQAKLKVFAIPQAQMDEIDVSQPVGIKEPFKRLTIMGTVEKDGKVQDKKVLVGVKYRTDDTVCFERSGLDVSQIEEATRWSPASQLPDFAVRRYADITTADGDRPLRDITESELRLMCLDYASQNNPQLLLEEYLPIKNFELLYDWWKKHYKTTLKDTDNPVAALLHIQLRI